MCVAKEKKISKSSNTCEFCPSHRKKNRTPHSSPHTNYECLWVRPFYKRFMMKTWSAHIITWLKSCANKNNHWSCLHTRFVRLKGPFVSWKCASFLSAYLFILRVITFVSLPFKLFFFDKLFTLYLFINLYLQEHIYKYIQICTMQKILK